MSELQAGDGIATWLLSGIITILGYLGIRQVGRIDALEKNSIDKNEYNETIAFLRKALNDHNEKILRSNEKVLDAINDSRREISGQIHNAHKRIDDLMKGDRD